MNLSPVVHSFGTLSLINFVRKTCEKLGKSSDQEVRALAEILNTGINELSLAYAARRPLLALWKAATQAKDAADGSLDKFFGSMSYDLLSPALLNGNRNHPDYRVLYPEGNINFIHRPDRAEVIQAEAIITYLKANPSHPMASRVQELEMKVAALDTALDPQTTAEDALHAAERVEKEKRKNLGRSLQKVQAQLHSHFMDKDKEDAFFPTIAESKVNEDEEDATEGATAAETPPAKK
jgi:hypothetical protein